IDVARLNMSHGTQEQHAEVYRLLREASDTTGHGVGILADLQGPKIRLGRFADGPVRLTLGDEFTVTTEDVPGNRTEVSTTYGRRPEDAGPVRRIMDEEGRTVPLLAKIEKPQAVERLEDIVEAFDGIMVARGDLGVELPLEQVPIVQKRAIELTREKARPVI